MDYNPYQTPAANVEGAADANLAEAETVRKEHIGHEASIKSVGILYYLGALGLLIAGIAQFGTFSDSSFGFSIGIAAFFIGLGALYFWIGSGLRKLKRSIKNVAGVFSVLGLINFPVGTIINGYILYLLYSKKGTMVFSDKYQNIIDATPHIKYKTSIVIWIILALLLLLIGTAVIYPLLDKP